MKIYSQILSLDNPKEQTFYTAQYSDYKIGLKVVRGGNATTGSIILKLGDQVISQDPLPTDGYRTYTLKSGVKGTETYMVEYSENDALVQVFEINHVTTDSTVFEVGGEGGSTPEGNFVRSVNGELPVNGNVEVSKLAITDGYVDGDTILQSIENVEDELDKKANTSDIVPVSPSTSAGDNELAGAKATANFVNSSINALAAFYITMDADGTQFPTKADLDGGPYYNAGNPRQPTQNDYAIVTEDEDHENATTRYIWQQGSVEDGFWEYQYTINRTPLTQAQLDALDSGITANKVNDMVLQSQLDANVMTLAGQYEDGESFSFELYKKA